MARDVHLPEPGDRYTHKAYKGEIWIYDVDYEKDEIHLVFEQGRLLTMSLESFVANKRHRWVGCL